jgi:hypothetical protein
MSDFDFGTPAEYLAAIAAAPLNAAMVELVTAHTDNAMANAFDSAETALRATFDDDTAMAFLSGLEDVARVWACNPANAPSARLVEDARYFLAVHYWADDAETRAEQGNADARFTAAPQAFPFGWQTV